MNRTGMLYLSVAVAGFLGTALRYGLGLAFPNGTGFPTTTLLINVTGSLALGLLTGYWSRSPARAPWLRTALGTGFLGSYTTFSSVLLFVDGSAALAERLTYLGLSLALSIAVAWVGMRLGAGSGTEVERA